MITPRKKLIEVSMPLEAINAASAREKSIRHGHPSTLHLWWARRPLAACRAVIFGQLVDDPSGWPDRFATKEAQDAERERLHGVIAEMVEWPKSTAADQARWERALDSARFEIARSFAWGRGEEPPKARADVLAYLAEQAPPVYDPFCGGGSIPLEAQRLGLRAYGSDLNPVPVLISKALVEIPPKFAGLAPVHPDTDKDLLDQPWRGARGLAEDVRYYGRWMRDQAKERIGHLYPDATLPNGQTATVIAWLWARTVRSPDPAAKGAMVPLSSSFVLSAKRGRETIVRVIRDGLSPDGWRFQVQQGGVSEADLAAAKLGTKSGPGGAFICALTGSPIERTYIQRAGKADELGVRLMAVVAEGERVRAYLSPTPEHERTALSAGSSAAPSEARSGFLSGSTPTRAMITGGVSSAYGLSTWGHLFTDRQLVALTTFSDLIAGARQKVFDDATSAARSGSTPIDARPLAKGGRGSIAYADAIATYLSLAVSRTTNYCSVQCVWSSHPKDELAKQVFLRQAMPMLWDFAETNVFSDSGGGFLSNLNWLSRAIPSDIEGLSGQIYQIDAPRNSYPITPTVISTDPPYYDNIAYSDLSDYFYVWLRRSLLGIWPELFRRLETPKMEELVASPFRYGGKVAAETHFLDGMKIAISAMRHASDEKIPLVIYYAFKQSEKSSEGVTSAGWASFLQAIVNSGLLVDGTWPIRTELVGNLKKSNFLASSIVLVCRPRPVDATITTRRDFVAELRRELPEALQRMRAAGTHPVDIPQSALGPGMAVFSKYAVVREADDTPMSVGRALTLINQVRGEIDHADSGDLDASTRFALDWFENFGWGAKPAGEAIKLAGSYDLTEKGLRDAGVLTTERGEARLTARADIPADWRPSTDRTLTAWEMAQALNRSLNDGGGVSAAGALLAEARGLSADVRWLTGRLFAIAEDRKLTDEARGWGRLSEAWDAIETAAARGEVFAVGRTGDLF